MKFQFLALRPSGRDRSECPFGWCARAFAGTWPGIILAGALALAPPGVAQQTNEVEELKRQLRELQAAFEKQAREHQQQLDALSKKIEDLTKSQAAEAEKKKLEQELAADLAKGQPPASAATNATPTPSAEGPAWSPSAPLQVRAGGTYADVGLVATFAAGTSTAKDIEGGTQLGGHDPNQRGFTVQGVELNLAGAVDPYFRGNANILFSIDSSGESFVELEEAWLETMSLPANLQLRAGQILSEFGRLNPTHPHTWAFVDSPIVLARFLGTDGLRNPGARLSWLAPTPFYSELFLSVQNSQGGTAASFRDSGFPHDSGEGGRPFAYRYNQNDRGIGGVEDMLWVPRYAVSFDLTDTQVLLGGVSAAFGPNSSGSPQHEAGGTQIYGADLMWKWKSAKANAGFPFVSMQAEALARRYEAGRFDWDLNANGLTDPGEIAGPDARPAVLSREVLWDYGFYWQGLYGFKKGWVAGIRYDFVTGERGAYERQALTLDGVALGRDPNRAQRWRISPDITWYPSEFSKIRLQYNYDERQTIGADHSVWLEFEFLLGAHAAHKF